MPVLEAQGYYQRVSADSGIGLDPIPGGRLLTAVRPIGRNTGGVMEVAASQPLGAWRRILPLYDAPGHHNAREQPGVFNASERPMSFQALRRVQSRADRGPRVPLIDRHASYKKTVSPVSPTVVGFAETEEVER